MHFSNWQNVQLSPEVETIQILLVNRDYVVTVRRLLHEWHMHGYAWQFQKRFPVNETHIVLRRICLSYCLPFVLFLLHFTESPLVMSTINKRSTRKRAAVTYTVVSSESEEEPCSKKQQKYFWLFCFIVTNNLYFFAIVTCLSFW